MQSGINKPRKLFGYAFLFLIAALNVGIFITGKQFVYKALIDNFPNIDDYLIFDNRRVDNGTNPQPWKVSSEYNRHVLSNGFVEKQRRLEAVALLIIHRDSLLYEEYWDGYSDSSYSNSFSMAKSMVGLLTGIALKEGNIKNLDQPVGDFLSEFKEGDKKNITIRHLLTMSGGTNWDESYINPFSMTTEAYYGNDLRLLVSRLDVATKPGKYFDYLSGETQLLGLVLMKATGKSLSQYASEKLWKPLGASMPALWSIDRKGGDEKAFCCFFSNARDFARIGQLVLQNGNWKGQQLINEDYLRQAMQPASYLIDKITGKQVDFYGFQWWIIPKYKGEKIVYCRGILGQYILVIPSKELVIVRLGKKRGKESGKHYEEVFDLIDEGLAMIAQKADR